MVSYIRSSLDWREYEVLFEQQICDTMPVALKSAPGVRQRSLSGRCKAKLARHWKSACLEKSEPTPRIHANMKR
jgi:hypothetical protein